MRLTLRTLLAYRDGVLKPSDYEDLHQRIQQSQDAANLLRRIESLSAELQRTSTTIVGRGLGEDPNYLAEYLDDALHSEKVPELERVCLQSSPYLAELAACHQLVATALHTHVRLSDELKQLALAVGRTEDREKIKADLRSRRQRRSTPGAVSAGAQPQAAHDTSADAQSQAMPEKGQPVQVRAPMLASRGESIKQQGLNLEGAGLTHEVPEYLVGTSSRDWRIPAAIAALFILLAILLRVSLGPFDRLGALFRGDVPVASRESSSPPATDETGPSAVNSAEPKIEESKEPPPDPRSEGDGDSALPDQDSGDDGSVGSTATSGVEAGNGELTTANEGSNDLLAEDRTVDNSTQDAIGDLDLHPETETGGREQERDTQQGSQPLSGQAVWAPGRDELPALLLVDQPQSGPMAIKPGAAVPAGETLVIAPHSVVSLKLTSSLTWKVVHATRVQINDRAIKLAYGRGMLISQTANSVSLETSLGKFDLQLGPNTTAAVELMFRRETHGSILDPTVFRPILVVVAVDGGFTVRDEAGNQVSSLDIGKGLAIIDGLRPKEFKLQSIPGWYRLSTQRAIDREGLLELTESIQSASLTTSLRRLLHERCQSSRPEEAAAAIQTALLLGDFEPLLESGFLMNPRTSIHWGATLQLFRQLLPLFPDQIAPVKESFLANFPDGNKVFAMVLGLSAEQAQSGGLSKLIDELASPNLVNRVVAIQELSRLTGRKLGFQPADPNRASLLTWRRELATEKVGVVPVGDIIWERRLP